MQSQREIQLLFSGPASPLTFIDQVALGIMKHQSAGLQGCRPVG
jgi:hypothetical protein